MVNLPISSKVQLKNKRCFFHAPRFSISCKLEGNFSLENNARSSLNFDLNWVVQLAEGVVCDFTPLYKLILAFSNRNLPSVHKG